ncbi:MAG: hypothetical protein AABP62_27225 [Planctomycetota bacterium]
MVGKIMRVPLRDVWAHEALDFTPWLLDNLDFLNDVLPFELIEAEREQAAGTSWVDVVAKDADGGIVVIENQLGTSDHDHLGKVLTYLATYEAKRAIWIVRNARPEHIQAINWLNELGPVDFFLVKAETVRIGNSEPAAIFTLITGPSDPLRTAGDTKRRQVSRKSESLSDVIDECQYFAKMSKKDRKEVARTTEFSVRMLSHRSGVDDAFSVQRNHSNFIEFIARHPRLLEAVKHIFEQNGKDKKIGRYFSTGYAAAMLYLMGSAHTNREAYNKAEDETACDWSMWDKAREFWMHLATGIEQMNPIREALERLDEGTRVERCALIVKAWNSFASGETITPKTLELMYKTDEDGVARLAETPVVGGIDVGEPREAE